MSFLTFSPTSPLSSHFWLPTASRRQPLKNSFSCWSVSLLHLHLSLPLKPVGSEVQMKFENYGFKMGILTNLCSQSSALCSPRGRISTLAPCRSGRQGPDCVSHWCAPPPLSGSAVQQSFLGSDSRWCTPQIHYSARESIDWFIWMDNLDRKWNIVYFSLLDLF